MKSNTSGVIFIILGIGVSLNFFVAGPRAYGSGLVGVTVGVISGIVLILLGIYMICGRETK